MLVKFGLMLVGFNSEYCYTFIVKNLHNFSHADDGKLYIVATAALGQAEKGLPYSLCHWAL